MKETRFRDVLACEENWEILNNVLRRTFQKYINFETIDFSGLRVIAKEFPLVRDKVGYQLRYIDILAINKSNDLIIIELKKNYNKKTNIDNIIKQIEEYEELIEENIINLRNHKSFLSIFHFYQKEIFNFMEISLDDINRIFKVILFVKNSDPIDFSKFPKVPLGVFNENEFKTLAKNYVDFQINRIDDITPGFIDLLKNECYINSSESPKYRPIPLTAYDNSELPLFRFESLYTNQIKSIKINKNRLVQSWQLPKLYPKESTQISNDNIFNKLLNGKYYIQIFRSGRANPIFYFEYEKDKFFPFHQIKAHLFHRSELVNKTIALDASGLITKKSRKTIFEEVILFDMGSFKSQIINEYGVKLKLFQLIGTRYNIEFEMIGPKIKTNLSKKAFTNSNSEIEIPPLLPFMEPEKIKEQINNYKRIYFINPFTDDWITTILRIKPIE